MKIEIRGICMRQISVNRYVTRVHKNERNALAQYKISLLCNFISFSILIYIYLYIHTFLNSMLVLEFCDRNSSAESMSGRSSLQSSPLRISSFSSKCIRHYACSQSGSQYWFIINKFYKTKLWVRHTWLRSTHKCLNIYYPS